MRIDRANYLFTDSNACIDVVLPLFSIPRKQMATDCQGFALRYR